MAHNYHIEENTMNLDPSYPGKNHSLYDSIARMNMSQSWQ